ncbi:hypothetical protein GWI33_006405 [Rhynchophorus ferrugineus]|uniref:Uncharacterized protein n=1 Tax=Rhynchophorus ferrugineus TaxID=354439 RepID=A0A834IL90_RHYFE|nr:hypothetical protein GWI33_006405 [Rhynchophorus ferrugineus]
MDMNQLLKALMKVHQKITKNYPSLCEQKQRNLVRRDMMRRYGVQISDTEYYYVLDLMEEQYFPTLAEDISIDSDEEIELRQYEPISHLPDYSGLTISEDTVPEYQPFYINQCEEEIHQYTSDESDIATVSVDTDNTSDGSFIWNPKLGIYRHIPYIIPPR